MNQLEKKAVKSLLNVSIDNDAENNWDSIPQNIQDKSINQSTQTKSTKSLKQFRKIIKPIRHTESMHQKLTIENQSLENENESIERVTQQQNQNNKYEELLNQYNKQIFETKQKMQLMYQQKFDIKAGWLKFSQIIFDGNPQKLMRRYKRSSLEIPMKDYESFSRKQAQIKLQGLLQEAAKSRKIFENLQFPKLVKSLHNKT